MSIPPSLADRILKRPDARLQLAYLQDALADEAQRRKDFYEWVTPGIKAEFINGKIVVHSPVKRQHWKITDLLSRLLSIFVSVRKLGVVGTEKVMISLTRNDYEPDLVFFAKEKSDLFEEDQALFPAPDFAVEILSKKTAAVDRGAKKQDYAAHGVREYWIIDPHKERVEQYILPSGAQEYFPAKHHPRGALIESYAIPGFDIPVDALFDEAANLEALQTLMGGA